VTTISIHGSRFRGRGFAGPSKIRIGPDNDGPQNVTDVVVVSDRLITCTIPDRDPSWPERVGIWITTPHGTGVRHNSFHYLPPPVLSIASVAPSSGDRYAETTVTVTGSKFTTAVAVALVFAWGDATNLSFAVDSDTQITATMPSGNPSAGLLAVRVTLASGEQVALANAWRWTLDTITVESITPDRSDIGGASVVLVGTRFTQAVDVQIEQDGAFLSRGFSIDSDTQISFTMPDVASADLHAGTVRVHVIGGEIDAYADFTYEAMSAIYGSPSSGPVAGFTMIVEGTRLDTVTQILGVPTPADIVPFTPIDEQTMSVAIPAGLGVGWAQLFISNGLGESAQLPFVFE
jgi:hypothetical protein